MGWIQISSDFFFFFFFFIVPAIQFRFCLFPQSNKYSICIDNPLFEKKKNWSFGYFCAHTHRVHEVEHSHNCIAVFLLSFTPGTPPKELNSFHTNCLPYTSDVHINIPCFFLIFIASFCHRCRRRHCYLVYFVFYSCDLSRFLYFYLFLSLFSFVEYYENLYYPQYECNIPLLDQAAITATSSLRERGPENARLNGKNLNEYFNNMDFNQEG